MKKVIVNKKVSNQDLFDFMLLELGGEAVVMKRFYGARIAQMASEGMQLSDLRAEAKDNEWIEDLERMTLKNLAEIVNPASIATTKSTTTRLTKEQIAQARDDALVFLGENPWQSKIAIADAISFDRKKMGMQLKVLRDEDKVKTVGEKAAMKYALKSEASQP